MTTYIPLKRFDNEEFVILGNAAETKHSVAVAAAQEGARVVLGLRRGERMPEVSEGDGVSIVTIETSEPGIERLLDKSLERLENLSVLVHCLSAPVVTGRSLAAISRREWDQVMSIYLREPFLSSQRAIQEFLAMGEGGHVIFVLSAPSDTSTSPVGYAVVQSALYAFIRSIAKEYGRRGIFCNAIAICSDVDSRHIPGSSKSCDAVVETVLFLASREASFVNGEMIPVTHSATRNT